MTESYKLLQTQAEELEAENRFLKEKIDELKNDLDEEKQCHHYALVRYKEIEEEKQCHHYPKQYIRITCMIIFHVTL